VDKAKYIIVIERGHEVAIIFSSLIEHAVIGMGHKVVSAGFCEAWGVEPDDTSLDTLKVAAWGRSISLKDSDDKYIVSRPEDAALIKKMLYNE